jgi:hypothetical protein
MEYIIITIIICAIIGIISLYFKDDIAKYKQYLTIKRLINNLKNNNHFSDFNIMKEIVMFKFHGFEMVCKRDWFDEEYIEILEKSLILKSTVSYPVLYKKLKEGTRFHFKTGDITTMYDIQNVYIDRVHGRVLSFISVNPSTYIITYYDESMLKPTEFLNNILSEIENGIISDEKEKNVFRNNQLQESFLRYS